MPVASTALPAELSNIILTQTAKTSRFAQLSPSVGQLKQRGQAHIKFSKGNRSRVVAENTQKAAGTDSISVVEIRPHTFVYSERVSKQFLKATEEEQIDLVSGFLNQAGSQLAVDFDYVVATGKQPGTSTVISGVESFGVTVTAKVDSTSSPYDDILGAEGLVAAASGGSTGLAISPQFRSSLKKETTSVGTFLFPPGSAVDPLGIPTQEVGTDGEVLAIVGDFSEFAWGAGVEDFQVIEYGDPDGAGDLARFNQVMLRVEVGYGWKIFTPSAFARVQKTVAG